jgi:CAAX prenyl protease-like protein
MIQPQPPHITTERAPGASATAYVLPMALFLALTAVERNERVAYPWIYLVKIGLVSMALIACRATWKDIRPTARVILPAMAVGLAVLAEWIFLDRWISYPHLGRRAAYNPILEIPSPGLRALFLTERFYGLVIMVPLVEELFWRSFLLRLLTHHDYTRLPQGTFSAPAYAIVAVAFGLSHPEWLAAILCACAYGLLLRQTRSLFACIVAHAVTNLGLGVYVLLFHQWAYW